MPDKKKSKLKLSKESKFKPFPLARKAVANRLYSTISPDVYGDEQVVKEKIGDFIQGTRRETTQDQYSEDAWAKYLGLEQPGGSLTRSEHRPSVSKNKRTKYHRLPDEFEQQLLQGYQQNKEYIQFEQEDRTKMPMNEMMMPGSSGSVLGNFTVGEGIDEETGQRYLSYYDKYDIAPNPAEGIMGSPFEIYNRINLPDETNKTMSNFENGGSLANEAMSQFALACGGKLNQHENGGMIHPHENGGQLELMGLPEYGFGSWLKDNAAGLLKGASALVGNIPIVGNIASGLFDLAGTAIGAVQKNKADKLAAEAEQGRLDEEAASQAEANRMTNLDLRSKNVVNQNQASYSATFQEGGDLGGSIDSLAVAHPWINRALTDTLNIDRGEGNPSSSVSTFTFSDDEGHYVAPTIRKVGKKLKEYDYTKAEKIARKNKDAVRFNTLDEAERFSQEFSNYLGSRNIKKQDGGLIGNGLMEDNTQQPVITEYSKKANNHNEGVGGIPVDAKGNPATVSNGSVVGLTEAGEVTWNGYVFSDKLKVNKK